MSPRPPEPSRHSKVVTIIQARTTSTRLPGKVLLPLAGQPLLLRQVERVYAARLVGTVVVAIPTDVRDDVLLRLCQQSGIPCFRGHPHDLLDRHYQAGLTYHADVVVKIPCDCPLIDPQVIDRVLAAYLVDPTAYDYVSNLHPATYPDGNDVEVMSMFALKQAWREAKRDFEREHTTPFLWENPGRFRLGNVTWETGQNYAMSHRWTIDYAADYEFLSTIYAALYSHRPRFSLADILALLQAHPEIADLNARYAGINWYRHHLQELHTITPDQTRKEPAL